MATLPPGVGGAVPLVVAEAALGLLFRFSQDQGSSGADVVGDGGRGGEAALEFLGFGGRG